ncbi:SufE family protein [Methanohalophilus euhalobius]|uniref:Cysteine desulfuration protein SufE n=1 Tax=Methanohalophilus euhalobius TaxID=51203 RepID=A0A315A0V6_9EURY|nr:SufE family protein [Methanohalophilus euhalobius]KXS45375.1 MAG: cysteine desulfuration protein SufE [Methanohalophilus sp. T328-1]PQV43154.1 cysteine desulfuration protein SufE [Methanohalophilus euhalobius]RNI09285.1 SufE family protein [Methanohalophilus euhalobius]RSD35088.1 MAG: cysteine desulfuration protein SufE [Methanohalophilus sp.]
MTDAIQDEIIREFDGLEWLDRYDLLIALAKKLEPMDEDSRTDENSISGCQSRVWIQSYKRDGKLNFNLDSDAMITKGIMALLLRVVNNRHPQEIANIDLYFIERIGLKSNLSPARSNGLESIIRRIKEIAKNEFDQSNVQ